MPYADTDFFIALYDTDDRLNSQALAVYERNKGKIYTSVAVAIELSLIAVRRKQAVANMLASALALAELRGADKAKVLLAAHFIDKYKLTVFDAFHAALCDGEIISSDGAYDRLGIARAWV